MSIENLSQNIFDLYEKSEALGQIYELLQQQKGKVARIDFEPDNTFTSEFLEQVNGQPTEAAKDAVAHCLESIMSFYARHDIESIADDAEDFVGMEINPQDFIYMD